MSNACVMCGTPIGAGWAYCLECGAYEEYQQEQERQYQAAMAREYERYLQAEANRQRQEYHDSVYWNGEWVI